MPPANGSWFLHKVLPGLAFQREAFMQGTVWALEQQARLRCASLIPEYSGHRADRHEALHNLLVGCCVEYAEVWLPL